MGGFGAEISGSRQNQIITEINHRISGRVRKQEKGKGKQMPSLSSSILIP